MRFLPCCLLLLIAPAAVADDWALVAETSGFRETSDHAATQRYIERLAEASDAMTLTRFGRSAQGRPMTAVTVATGDRAARGGKAVVVIQNAIHAGEVDGKDASLMLLRDLMQGEHPEILAGVVLHVIPIYNVDGHERVSPFNRANQNGPVAGMGFRTTTNGRDLNRDHLKLDTQEAQQMISWVASQRPHLHVDDHVTNGVDHDWTFTWSWAEAPQIDATLGAWLDANMPPVMERVEAAGYRTGPYVSLVDRNDPTQGINSGVNDPHFATGYWPLRHVPSILVENHSYKPYRDRVMANYHFLVALLKRVAAERASLIEAVATAERRMVARGRSDAEPSELVLRWKVVDTGDTVDWPVYEWYREMSPALGVPIVKYRRGEVRQTEVPWLHRLEPAVTVARPRGYLIEAGWPAIEERLRVHGVRFRTLNKGLELDVETIRVSDPRPDARSRPTYQGRHLIEMDVSRQVERREVERGALWVPADQPLFEIAAQLLEPEAPDSLISWGILSSVFERKEYIESALLDRFVPDLLQNPEIAAEWEKALEDESFASNPGARWMWWYRRTPYWDERVGLMPAYRVMAPHDKLVRARAD